jgi:hypothetical protein
VPPRLATEPVRGLAYESTAIEVIGSSALVPVDEPRPLVREPTAAQPLDPGEASTLRRMLPRSRMRWAALLLVVLVAGGLYGIVRARSYLAEQSARSH